MYEHTVLQSVTVDNADVNNFKDVKVQAVLRHMSSLKSNKYIVWSVRNKHFDPLLVKLHQF